MAACTQVHTYKATYTHINTNIISYHHMFSFLKRQKFFKKRFNRQDSKFRDEKRYNVFTFDAIILSKLKYPSIFH